MSVYRGSIAMHRSGSWVGHNGPTAFITNGKKRQSGFTADILIDKGYAPQSAVATKENSFMMEAAWEDISPATTVGYWAIPTVINNPQWSMLEISNRFGAHLNNLTALEMCYERKY